MILDFINSLGNAISAILTDVIYDSGLYVSESGVEGNFTIKLSDPKNVTLNITSDHCSFVPDQLVFTTGDYDTPQAVTISTDGSTFNGVIKDIISARDDDGKLYGMVSVLAVDNNIDSDLYDDDPADHYHWTTEADLDAMRIQAIEWIWGVGASLPTDTLSGWTTHTNDVYINLDGFIGLDSCEKSTLILSGDWEVVFYHFIPTSSNGKMILNPIGHGDNWNQIQTHLMGDAFEYFVNEGYHVIGWYMVGRGPNPTGDGIDQGVGGDGGTHDQMIALESSSPYFNPLDYFLRPGIAAVNYAVAQGYADIFMHGLSGGGWTSAWIPGIDTRIDKSFALCGTQPKFIHYVVNTESGDYEQGVNNPADDPRSSDFVVAQYDDETSYLDLHCLSAQGRAHYVMHNINDPSASINGYYTTIYKDSVKDKLGSIGTYNSFVFDGPANHQYTEEMFDQILALL